MTEILSYVKATTSWIISWNVTTRVWTTVKLKQKIQITKKTNGNDTQYSNAETYHTTFKIFIIFMTYDYSLINIFSIYKINHLWKVLVKNLWMVGKLTKWWGVSFCFVLYCLQIFCIAVSYVSCYFSCPVVYSLISFVSLCSLKHYSVQIKVHRTSGINLDLIRRKMIVDKSEGCSCNSAYGWVTALLIFDI